MTEKTKKYGIILRTKKEEKYAKKIRELPAVTKVKTLKYGMRTKYLVQLETRQRKSYFRSIPYLDDVQPYKFDISSEEETFEDDSSSSERVPRKKRDRSEYIKYSPYISIKKARQSFQEIDDEHDRRLEAEMREFYEQQKLVNLLGFGVDTDDKPKTSDVSHEQPWEQAWNALEQDSDEEITDLNKLYYHLGINDDSTETTEEI